MKVLTVTLCPILFFSSFIYSLTTSIAVYTMLKSFMDRMESPLISMFLVMLVMAFSNTRLKAVGIEHHPVWVHCLLQNCNIWYVTENNYYSCYMERKPLNYMCQTTMQKFYFVWRRSSQYRKCLNSTILKAIE